MTPPTSTISVGPFGVDGKLTHEQVSEVLAANKYKGWLYLLPEDNPESPVEAVTEAGLDFKCIPVSVPDSLTKETADKLVDAVKALPQPAMIQCSSGARSSAALLLYLGAQGNLGAEKVLALGESLGLKCMRMKPLVNWISSAAECWDRAEPSPLLFRQFFDKESSTYTYLLADSITKDAVLIDPVLEQVTRDLATVDQLGLNLVYVINTHCHADHVTGTGEIKNRCPGVKSGISRSSGAKADILYEPGDTIKFGSHELKVFDTPGHTGGCVTYYTENNGGMCFTGDTLMIRGCGRTDFQDGDPGTLYESVHAKLFTLPESTKVYPAHDYKGQTSSTVGEEKKFNPRLTKPKPDFIDLMNNLGLAYPKKIDVAHPANMACGFHEIPEPAS